MAITPFGAVVLLLHCDDAEGSKTLQDKTSYALNAACYGAAGPSKAQSKFGGVAAKTGSGAGNYFAVGTNQLLDFSSGDFTIEAFVCPVSQGADGGAIVGRWDGTHNDFLLARNADGALQMFVNGTLLFATAAGDLPFNAFAHVALTRYNGVMTIWVNGADKGHADLAGAISFTRGVPLYFGQASQAGETWLEAYYDEIRVTTGLAQYTDAFAPPAAPFGLDSDADPYFNNVSLLLHCDGIDGGKDVIDSSSNHLPVTVNGNAVLRAEGSLYGSASLLFDGNDSYLTVPNSEGFSFGSGDFTLELSVKWSTVRSTGFIQQSEATGGYILKWTFGWYSGRLTLSGHNPASTVMTWIAVDWTPAADTQYHIACVKHGTSFSMYVNGQQIGATAASSTPMPTVNSPLYIGRFYDTPLWPDMGNMAGRFDEIRITKGVAREVLAYAPPASTFPDKAGGTATVKPRVTRLVPSTFTVFTSPRPLAVPSAQVGRATLRVHDYVNGGFGRISGTVTVNGAPSSRKLRLFVARSGVLIAQTWSALDGAYSFKGIAPDREYFVVGHDYMRIYNAEVQDMLTPEVAA
ncbi:LamG domain-containing protein [Ralstonia pseudosolanacearum]